MCEALHKTSRSLLLSLRALRISAVSALKGFAQKVFAGTVAASPPRCAAGRCLAAGSGFAPRFLDQRSNEGRSPNEEKTFSARQSRASHHGGKAAPHITAAKPRLTSRRQSRASHHGGEAAPHITAAKPLRTDSLCKAALKRPVTAEDAEGRRAPQRRQRSQLVPSVQSWGVKSLRLCPGKTTASLRKLSVLYSSNQKTQCCGTRKKPG